VTKHVTDHPDYDPKDFLLWCCNGTGLVETRGDVIHCPRCEALAEKYRDYLPKPSPPSESDDGIPF